MYAEIPDWIKGDIGHAYVWAKSRLISMEGGGHHIVVTGSRRVIGAVECSFAKSSWSSDYSGSPMDEAAEAIVMAVCEYLNGM